MWAGGGRSRSARWKRGDGSRGPRTSSPTRTTQNAMSTSQCGLRCAASNNGDECSVVRPFTDFVAAIRLLQDVIFAFFATLVESCSSSQAFSRVQMPCSRESPQWNYGGEFAEVIRFMRPNVGGALEQFNHGDGPAAEDWEHEFDKEVSLIESLPFVKGGAGVSVSEQKANLNKAYVSVWCCWEKSRKSFKQVCVACDEDKRPTHLEAMHELRSKLMKEHGHPEHVVDPRAAERRSAIEAVLSESSGTIGGTQQTPAGGACSASDREALRQRASGARDALEFLMAGSQLRSKREAAEKAQKVAGQRELEANLALQSAKVKQKEVVAAREAVTAALADLDALREEIGQLKRVRNRQISEGAQDGATATTTRISLSEVDLRDDSDDDGGECGSPPDWSTWTLAKWKKMESLALKRRSETMKSSLSDDRSPPPRGDEKRGWRWHWRRGLIGTIQDWAEGRRFRVVHMLVEMACYFKVEAEVASGMGFGLTKDEVEALKVDKFIVDRLREALAQLKQCRSEEERVDYHTVLAAVAPRREAARDRAGMIRAVCDRLGVARGARYVKGKKRPYVFEQAITQREKFDVIAQDQCAGPLKPGDNATSRGQSCSIVEIDHAADTCKLSFSVGGAVATRSYACIYKGVAEGSRSRALFPVGSARLRPAPPSLRPPKPRETRSDEKAEAARPKVEELYCAEGARSPSQKDAVHRRLGRHVYETAQALIVYSKSSALYQLFCERYRDQRISLSLFRRLRPWYVRRAKEESCLCKHCDNFKQQLSTLKTVADLLEPLLEPPSTADAEDAPDNDDETAPASGWPGAPATRKLINFCRLDSKSAMVRSFLCEGAFNGAGKEQCINGSCQHCGFKQVWSEGLRRHVVAQGNVLSTAPVQFQSIVKWVRIKSSKEKDADKGQDTRYDARQGTVVQFLDELEQETCKKFPHHRFTIQRQKAMDSEFDRHRWPGWILLNIDFAMDGTIPPPQGRSMQSDHWSPMSYTLFPAVASWLSSEAWQSRSSVLKEGDAVTVEPMEASRRMGTDTPADGSHWAEVVSVPGAVAGQDAAAPELKLYGVRRHGAAADTPLEMVPRHLLRHRKIHTEAYVHVSDDKTHDSFAAQVFLNKTLKHLDENFVKTGLENFVALRVHSDNAPSHFKCSKTMYYLTTLPDRLRSWGWGQQHSFRLVWEFGAPGHGKGVWDGIGAWMKRTVRQDVVDHTPNVPTVLTSDGHILSPKQVHEHLQARFETEEYVKSHVNKTINRVVLRFTPTSEVTRPRVEQTYDRLPGIKKTFIFMPVREGVTLMRRFSCWCDACMHAWAPGEGTMSSNYVCQHCESVDLPWKEASIERTDAAGISNARRRALIRARSLTDQLKAHFSKSNQPVWVAVQNRGEYDEDQYWIGKAVQIVKVHTVAGSVAGTGGRVRYDIGDCEVAVQWFERHESGGDERRVFTAHAAHGQTYTFNSTELRLISLPHAFPGCIALEMKRVPPVGDAELNVVQHVRASARLAGAMRKPNYRNVAYHVVGVHAERAHQLWEITEGSEKAILDHCV